MVSVQNWPELSNTELITYYNEIKANKVRKTNNKFSTIQIVSEFNKLIGVKTRVVQSR